MKFPSLNESFFRTSFVLLALGVGFGMPVLSLDYGVTWDEWNDGNIGLFVIRYLLSGGKDQIFLKFQHGYLYASLFHAFVGIVYGTFFDQLKHFAYEGIYQVKHWIPYFTTSHMINSLFGVAAMVYAGLLARLIGGWRAGFLGLLFMIVSPRFFGSSMNNPKDIPFAAAYVMSLYYLVLFIKTQPKPKISTLIGLTVGIGCAIGVRAGGLMLIGYLFLFSFCAWAASKVQKTYQVQWVRIGIYAVLAAIGGYCLGLVFWPYGQLNPLQNPLQALEQLSKFSFWDGQVMFEGKRIFARQLPWHYVPKWMVITAPLQVLAGLLLWIAFLRGIVKRYDLKLVLIVLFAALFPIGSVIVKKSVLYDSGRHLFFVYPLFVVLSVLGWDYVFSVQNRRRWKTVAVGLMSLLMVEPCLWMVRNHPNEYVYFNPLVGGLRRAWLSYDTDYWGNCIRPAAEWLGDHLANTDSSKEPILIRADSHAMSSFPFLKKRLGSKFRLYGYPPFYPEPYPYFQYYHPANLEGPRGWDYALVFSRNWEPEILRRGDWPPRGTIHEVKADGVTLCAVVKNPNKVEKKETAT